MKPERLESRRLLATGDLDPTFGDGGAFHHELPGDVFIGEMLTLPDGKMLFGGDTFASLLAEEEFYVLARYNADGTPDSSFGDNGMILGDFTEDESDSSLGPIALAQDGKIVAIGITDFSTTHLVRFSVDGSIDTSFGDDGFVPLLAFEDHALAVQPDGKVLVADRGGQIKRYLADGRLDTDFGDDGASEFDFLDGVDFRVMRVQADGKILLAGGFSQFTLARLNTDGSLDTTFGDQGIARANIAGAPDYFNRIGDVELLPDGKILAAGTASTSPGVNDDRTGFALIRFNADGTVDQTYNGGGTYIPFGRHLFFGHLVLDEQLNAYVVADRHSGLMAARVNADGEFDETFGRIVTDNAGNNSANFIRGATIQPNGNLVMTSQENRPTRSGTEYAHTLHMYRVLSDDEEPSPIVLDAGVLSLEGTSGGDLLAVTEDDEFLRVTREGFGRAFATADVQRVIVDADAGDDEVRISTHTLGVEANGDDGNDKISGGGANDTLRGGAGHDRLDGRWGADLIVGGGGHDRIRGQGGADHIYGRGGNDFVMGNGGNDRLDGGDGIDVLVGGSGDDIFLTADGAVDQLFGNDGADSADADEDDSLDRIESVA